MLLTLGQCMQKQSSCHDVHRIVKDVFELKVSATAMTKLIWSFEAKQTVHALVTAMYQTYKGICA